MANKDLYNICVTGTCVKLMYYPRCLGNKVVVLSKPRELELLWHQATYLKVRFNLHKIYLLCVLPFAPLVIRFLAREGIFPV